MRIEHIHHVETEIFLQPLDVPISAVKDLNEWIHRLISLLNVLLWECLDWWRLRWEWWDDREEEEYRRGNLLFEKISALDRWNPDRNDRNGAKRESITLLEIERWTTTTSRSMASSDWEDRWLINVCKRSSVSTKRHFVSSIALGN